MRSNPVGFLSLCCKFIFPVYFWIFPVSLWASSLEPMEEAIDGWNCSHYKTMSQNLVERGLNCKNSDSEYLESFGYSFCLRFLSTGILAQDEIGQSYARGNEKRALRFQKLNRWVWGTMKCLQEEMNHYLKAENNLSCQKVRKFGFRSHRRCYEENGFCNIFSFWDDIFIKSVGPESTLKFLPESMDMLGICFF